MYKSNLLPRIRHPPAQHGGDNHPDVGPKGVVVEVVEVQADLVGIDHLVVVPDSSLL